MPKNIYYHNPRCSKSRQGLQLLEEKKVSFTIKEYLKDGFTSKELRKIFKALQMEPIDVVRKKETLYKEVVSDAASLNQEDWIEIIIENPTLMERPILLTDKGARIGRPTENLLDIL